MLVIGEESQQLGFVFLVFAEEFQFVTVFAQQSAHSDITAELALECELVALFTLEVNFAAAGINNSQKALTSSMLVNFI